MAEILEAEAGELDRWAHALTPPRRRSSRSAWWARSSAKREGGHDVRRALQRTSSGSKPSSVRIRPQPGPRDEQKGGRTGRWLFRTGGRQRGACRWRQKAGTIFHDSPVRSVAQSQPAWAE